MNLTTLRETIRKAKPKKLIDGFTFKQPLKHGWLLPYLLIADACTWRRWEQWMEQREAGKLNSEPIRQIDWTSEHQGPGRKMLETCLNNVTKHGSWQGWSSWQYMNYFLDWLLFGLGDPAQTTEPKNDEGASERLYQLFVLETLIAYPYDYFGDILAENRHGRQNGFYPTPMDVVEMMTQMQMDTGEDMRSKKVMDPCTGTGRFILSASNYSYRLYCQDIDATVLKACKINGWLYSPWLVRPFPDTFFAPDSIPSAAEPRIILPPQPELGQLVLI